MAAYCGLLDAHGKPFPTIFNKTDKHQTWTNWVDNMSTYDMYLFRLIDLAMSVFEWKNLPEGIDQRQLEYWLLVNGYCLFFKDDDLKANPNAPEGYAVLQCMLSGQLNLYNLPTDRVAYSVDGINVTLDETNSVIIFNNYIRVPMMLTIEQYAWRLANVDRTIDVNVSAQKTPKVVPCDERSKLSFKNLLMGYDGNEFTLLTDKNFDVSQITSLDLTQPYVAGDLQILKHQYWNEILTFLGIENVNTEKKERLISDEVFSNMGDVEAQRFTRLNARKKACEEINRLFGLDVDVDFRSGIYIHADGYGAQNIPTSGMQDSDIISEQAGYDADDSGILARIKSLLGVG